VDTDGDETDDMDQQSGNSEAPQDT